MNRLKLRLVFLGALTVLFCSVAVPSWADRMGDLRYEIAKVQSYGQTLQAKLNVAMVTKQKARTALLEQMIRGNNARLAKLRNQLDQAVLEANTSTTTVIVPPPVIVRPLPSVPVNYELSLSGGYMANGWGVIGKLNFPNVFTNFLGGMKTGFSIGGGYVEGRNNTTNAPARYAPILFNGIVTLYSSPDNEVYFEGGLNYPVGGSGNGNLGGQAVVGASWGGRDKLFVEAGWATFDRTTAGVSSGAMVNLGYKVGF